MKENNGLGIELRDEELAEVAGGVSVDEMKALPTGTLLVYGGDMCEMEYLGRYRDPGWGYYYQLLCRVTKILIGKEKININGLYISDPMGGTTPLYAREGTEVWVARNDVKVI